MKVEKTSHYFKNWNVTLGISGEVQKKKKIMTILKDLEITMFKTLPHHRCIMAVTTGTNRDSDSIEVILLQNL